MCHGFQGIPAQSFPVFLCFQGQCVSNISWEPQLFAPLPNPSPPITHMVSCCMEPSQCRKLVWQHIKQEALASTQNLEAGFGVSCYTFWRESHGSIWPNVLSLSLTLNII